MTTRLAVRGGLVVLWLSTVCAAEVVVFGDSLSDTGNTFAITSSSLLLPDIPSPRDGYFSGRFSDGPVWVEYLADSLGLAPPTPSRLGGTNFAHGGAEVLNSGFLQPSLAEQVAELSVMHADDWHLIWMGANDLAALDLASLGPTVAAAQQAADEIQRSLAGLLERGAKQLAVLNLPVLNVLPLSIATLSADELDNLDAATDAFNARLSEQLRSTRLDNPTADILEFDVHALFAAVLAEPGEFGLVNVTDSAAPFDPDGLIPGLAASPPPVGTSVDEFLFYDGLHPTSAVHAILGRRVADAIAAVPEPGAFTLLLTATVFLCLPRGRTCWFGVS